jgi:hypothetical protein
MEISSQNCWHMCCSLLRSSLWTWAFAIPN